jgi:hypothetical protein
MLCNPGGRLHVSKPSIATTCQRIRWVHLAVKDHNSAAVGHHWYTPVIGGPWWDAMIFVACAPVGRPIAQTPLPMHDF